MPPMMGSRRRRTPSLAYYTEGHKDGTAKVKITQPGIWMVRVQHAVTESSEDYDRYVARAVLLLSILG